MGSNKQNQSNEISIDCELNGKKIKMKGHPMARLLDVLREEGEAFGTKEGCGEGECGACSILVDGVLVNSCLIPLIQAEKAEITTVEGLALSDEKLSNIQKAFLKYGGAQCGICTPGMLMAAHSLLQENPNPTDQEIQEGLAGNLCRCTGYSKIFESVVRASQEEVTL
jgi:carbon-monoxide dehydrogenase small subunit